MRNYPYSSIKNLAFFHVKKHTEVDLVLNNNTQSNAKLMLPCHPNDYKLKPNLLSSVKDRDNEEYNYNAWNKSKGNSVQACNSKYNKLVLNLKNYKFQIKLRNYQVIKVIRLCLC